MERTKEQLQKLILPNIATETLKRKWKRRAIGALTKEHYEKCMYFVKLYS